MVEKDADVFAMAVGEACKNAVLYSREEDHEKKFELMLVINEKRITAQITNKGKPFNIDAVPAFNKEQDFMQYKNGGLGIPIIKKFMDEVNYKREEGKNKLTLVRHLSSRVE